MRKNLFVVIATVLLVCSNLRAQKEIYRPDHDDAPYYFGLTLGYNSSFLHPTKSAKFLQKDARGQDSILVAEPGASGGISLGLMVTGRISDHFQVRLNPQLIIGGAKSFNYTLGARDTLNEEVEQKKILPSTIISIPLQIKLNSDRINNFRLYLLGGVKYEYDLSSTSSARNAEDLIKLKKDDFGLEFGLGCNFFLPFVTISPEIKFGYGLTNIHSRDANLKYSSVFDGIYSRMIMFSLHFED